MSGVSVCGKMNLLLIPLIVAIITVSGCVSNTNTTGSGNVINQTKNVTDFNQINLNGNGNIILIQVARTCRRGRAPPWGLGGKGVDRARLLDRRAHPTRYLRLPARHRRSVNALRTMLPVRGRPCFDLGVSQSACGALGAQTCLLESTPPVNGPIRMLHLGFDADTQMASFWVRTRDLGRGRRFGGTSPGSTRRNWSIIAPSTTR